MLSLIVETETGGKYPHCVHLNLIPLEVEVSNFLILCSTYIYKGGERRMKSYDGC